MNCSCLLFLTRRQHFVQGAHIGPGAGHDDIGAGAMAAEGAGDVKAGLGVGDVLLAIFRLDANSHFANGVDTFGNGLDDKFGQLTLFTKPSIAL